MESNGVEWAYNYQISHFQIFNVKMKRTKSRVYDVSRLKQLKSSSARDGRSGEWAGPWRDDNIPKVNNILTNLCEFRTKIRNFATISTVLATFF